MKAKHLILLLSAIFLPLLATAAVERPVTWTTSITSESATEGTLRIKADIRDGWHIYGSDIPDVPGVRTNPTRIVINPADGLELIGSPEPSVVPQKHLDLMMNLELPWWDKTVTFTQRFRTKSPAGAVISGTIYYMACNNVTCTPPAEEEFSVTFGNPASAAATDSVTVTSESPAKSTAKPATDDDASQWWAPVGEGFNTSVATSSAGASGWTIFIMGFLGGLLALLTPCVWPMIPMTVSFFLKSNKSRARSILNSCLYGLSIIVIFLVLGLAITAIFGPAKLNELSTSAVFNLIFFALLVLFAVSFFGAFDIKLPSRWSDAMDSRAEATSGLLSIFFMAFTLVLVSFSCTGPIIGTLLVEAVAQGEILGPALGMGGFALGLALPFATFAFFPSMLKSIPSSGGWLNSVKVVLGFIELILSLKFLSVADLAYGWRILDREVFISIWIVLFVLLGLYLLGKLRLPHDTESRHTSVGGLFMAVASLSFAVYLLPGLWGAPLKAVSAFAPPLSTQDFNLYGGEYREFHDYDEGMAYAAKHEKPVLLDFTGYGCVNCRKMEMAVFDTQAVREVIENDYVLIKLYVDEKTPLEQPYTVEEYGRTTRIKTVGDRWSYLQRHKFDINSQPYYVLLDNQGKPLAPARDYDENVDSFVQWLNQGLEAYRQEK